MLTVMPARRLTSEGLRRVYLEQIPIEWDGYGP